jgi:hypothetical protein
LILLLLCAAVVLLVTFVVTASLAMLFDQLNDAGGARLARGLTVACLVLLAVDLICLVLALGLRAAEPPDDPEP